MFIVSNLFPTLALLCLPICCSHEKAPCNIPQQSSLFSINSRLSAYMPSSVLNIDPALLISFVPSFTASTHSTPSDKNNTNTSCNSSYAINQQFALRLFNFYTAQLTSYSSSLLANTIFQTSLFRYTLQKICRIRLFSLHRPIRPQHILSNKSLTSLRKSTLDPILCSQKEAQKRIQDVGKRLHISKAIINNLINNLESPEIDGCLRTLATSIQVFESTSGFTELVKHIFYSCKQPKNYANAKGAMNEVRVALTLFHSGETILAFSTKINNHEYDILSTKYLVECKNVSWRKYTKSSKQTKRLMRQAQCGINSAHKIQKQYLWSTKKDLPQKLFPFRDYLITTGADLIQG